MLAGRLRRNAPRRGFTLVELLVVVVVLGLLAAIGAFAYNQVTESARKHAARMMAEHVSRDATGISVARQSAVSALTAETAMTDATGASGDAGRSSATVEWGTPDASTGAITAGVSYGAYCTPVWWPGSVARGELGATTKTAHCTTTNGTKPAGVTGKYDNGGAGWGSSGSGGGGALLYGGATCSEGSFTTAYITGKVYVNGYWENKAVFTHTHTGPGTANYRWYGLSRNNSTGALVYFWTSGSNYGAPVGDIVQFGPAFSDWPPAGTTMVGMGVYDTTRKYTSATLNPSSPSAAIGVTDPAQCTFYWGEPLFNDPASDRDVPFGSVGVG